MCKKTTARQFRRLCLVLSAVLWGALPGCENSVDPVMEGGDRTPPAVRELTPADNAADVPVDQPVVVEFSEPVDPATVGLSTFTVRAEGTPVRGTIRADDDRTRFVFTPEGGAFPYETGVEATIGAEVRDLAGNALQAATTWQFSTAPETFLPGTPVAPEPADGATGVALEPELAWSTVGGVSGVYDVYLAPEGATLERIASDLSEPRFVAGPLEPETNFAWQVEARVGSETRRGELWQFRTTQGDPTNQVPDAPRNPTPADGATDIPLMTLLEWEGGDDPDQDPVSFEVYLGTTDMPPLVATVDVKSYDPGKLTEGEGYRWRVIADDGRGGRSGGKLWSFSTTSSNLPPSAPGDPTPADGASGIVPPGTLAWSPSIDPDGDTVTYDLFLGTSDPPPLVRPGLVATSFDTTLSRGTAYLWQIVARDDQGHAVPGSIWTFTTNARPDAPTDPTPADDATDVPLDVVLAWQHTGDPDGDDVVFDVYVGAAGAEPPFAGTTDQMNFSPQGLVFDTEYVWRIVARDTAGGETSSSLWSFTTTAGNQNQPPTAPCAPSPANGAIIAQASVTLSWGCGIDPDGDRVRFDVFIGQTPFPTTYLGRTDYEIRAWGPFGVTSGTWYWRIIAEDEKGARTNGPVWSFTVNNAPTAPTSPQPADGQTGIAVPEILQWSPSIDPDGDPITYDLFVATSTPPGLARPGLVATFFDTTLSAGTAYFWRVVARDDHAHSASSSIWNFSTAPDNRPPAPATDPAPADGAIDVPPDVTLTWQHAGDPDGDDVEFDVYLGESGGELTWVTTTDQQTHQPAALAPATHYVWRVIARDPPGAETASQDWSFTTVPDNRPPEPATDPTPADGAIDVPFDVTLTWQHAGDPDGDDVEFDVYLGEGGGEPSWVATTDQQTYQPAALAPATHYVWRVIARDTPGAETASELWSFATVAGNRPPTSPCSPSPEDGEEIGRRFITLRWDCGDDPDGDRVRFDVYVGRTSVPTVRVGTTDYGERAFGPLGLSDGRWYWRVVAEDERGARTPGPVWSFDID